MNYERLSASDNTFLVLEKPNTHMHVAATTVFRSGSLGKADGAIDVPRLREYIASRLDRIPRYRQKLARVPVTEHPIWVDDTHFDIEYHVRHTSLPKPGRAPQLKRLAARIMSQQLDRAKPLWEFWIVEGLEGGEHFAVIHKAHHCMIDGVSGVDLMAVLMALEPTEHFSSNGRWSPRATPSSFELATDEIRRRVCEPTELFWAAPKWLWHPRTTFNAVAEGVSAVGETLAAGLSPTTELPFNRRIGPHRRFDWVEMELAEVKAVKNRLGGTLNDVVLAIVTGAVRTFLRGRGFDCRGKHVRANVPVSVRHDEEHGTLGNRIALWMTDLPVGEEDPLRRLGAIRKTTTALKQSKQALGAEVLAEVSELTTSTLLSLAVRISARGRPFNLVVTNVPGPQMPLYMLGAEMTGIYPMVNLLRNQGVGVALFSYAGKLCWGIVADFELMPDLDRFSASLEDSFKELKAIST